MNRAQRLEEKRKRDAEKISVYLPFGQIPCKLAIKIANLEGSASLAPMVLKLARVLEGYAKGDGNFGIPDPHGPAAAALAELDAFLDKSTPKGAS